VLSGSVEGIAAAVAGAKDKGIVKAIPLTVAGAYHSRLMKSAQDQLAPVLAQTAIRDAQRACRWQLRSPRREHR